MTWRTATDLNEQVLGMLGGGRPIFDYLAQLDRARIWVAGGNVDEALASLPAARTALKGQRSVLLALADELEARFRLALGDHAGREASPSGCPMTVASSSRRSSPSPPRTPKALPDSLTSAPGAGPTIRSDLELRLLRASVAIMRSSPQAPHLVREAVAIVDRYGFVQTVLDTAPPFVDHLIVRLDAGREHRQPQGVDRSRRAGSKGNAVPSSRQAARPAHRRRGTCSRETPSPAHLRRHGVRPAPLAKHSEDPPSPYLHEARRHLAVLSRQTSDLARPYLRP